MDAVAKVLEPEAGPDPVECDDGLLPLGRVALPDVRVAAGEFVNRGGVTDSGTDATGTAS